MMTLIFQQVSPTFFDRLFGRTRYAWAAALCGPNDEFDVEIGNKLAEGRLVRILRDQTDYLPARSGHVTNRKYAPPGDMVAKVLKEIAEFRALRGGPLSGVAMIDIRG